MRDAYFKLKVLELLLFLEMIDPEEVDTMRPYYNRTLVQKVKAAHRMMTHDLSRSLTIEEVSDHFGIAPTAFKSCFKGIFGEVSAPLCQGAANGTCRQASHYYRPPHLRDCP